MAQHFLVQALGMVAAAARRRWCSASSAGITLSGRTLQNSAILRRSFSGIGRSQRQSRICGWMPRPSSSLTECWVGLVFSSPAEPI